MKLAERVLNLKPSATMAVGAKAQELKSQGKDVISLSLGEPDFSTPKHICEAGKKAIDNGETRYTPVPGTPELRKAVAEFYRSCGAPSASIEHVIISNGGKHSIYNMCQAVINPGDQVLVPAPYWVSYPPMIELAEGKATIIPTTAAKGYKVTIADLNANTTPKTRVLIINSPSNPTGACYSQAEVDAIGQWAVDNDIIVFSDEIYCHIVFDGKEAPSFAPWWEKHPDNFIIANGASKTYAMTGWRIGYTLSSVDCAKAMTRIQGQSTSNACSIAQAATVAALQGGLDEVKEMRKAFEKRRDLVFSLVSEWPNVVTFKPEGAFYIFMDVHKLYTEEYPDSTSFCEYILEKAGVALVPGVAFGNDHCVRISCATSEELLTKALDRVTKALFA